jgi:hypothetical protein
MYQQIGFEWISNGITWWLMNPDFLRNPPSKKEIAISEAVGMGKISALEILFSDMTTEDINKPIRNDMSWIQLAVYCHQQEAAEWLVNHGVEYSVLDAWDLGWKEKAAILLQKNPDLVNQKYGNWQITLLHAAAERKDTALAKLALLAKPDLDAKDKTYNGTALGWAEHLGSITIAALIKEHMKSK